MSKHLLFVYSIFLSLSKSQFSLTFSLHAPQFFIPPAHAVPTHTSQGLSHPQKTSHVLTHILGAAAISRFDMSVTFSVWMSSNERWRVHLLTPALLLSCDLQGRTSPLTQPIKCLLAGALCPPRGPCVCVLHPPPMRLCCGETGAAE